MNALFIQILNMSLTASVIAVAVMLLRLVLKKAPKWISCILWGFVALRLLLPFSVESMFSIMPASRVVPEDILTDTSPALQSGVPLIDNYVNPIIVEGSAPSIGDSANPLQTIIFIAAIIWALGIVSMLIYTLISYINIRRRTAEAVHIKNNIYECDRIASPFILGIIRPKIYLPATLKEHDREFVIAHEGAHLKRLDHLIKPFGFLLLSVYWFNPIFWLCYVLLCRDIEAACDQRVIKTMGEDIKATYSAVLMNCSVPRRMIAACPVAFGETGVKSRIKGILSYKKPTFWIIIASLLALIVAAACLLTNKPTLKDELAVFLDMQIAEHHQSDETKDNFIAIDYDIMKISHKGDKTTVYMWVLYEEYSYKNGDINIEAGAHSPTVITVQKNDGQYKLLEYWNPRDGSLYVKDIRAKFPFYLWYKATNSQLNIDKQSENNERAAREYFSLNPMPLKDGSIEIYTGSTDERQKPVIFTTAKFKDKDLSEFLGRIKGYKWTNDALVDRLSFRYNCRISYDNKFIFIDLENSVVYCDGHFTGLTSRDDSLIREYFSKPKGFTITDKSKFIPNMAFDTAFEEFYRDKSNKYSFYSFKSEYIEVTYNNGDKENIKDALTGGRLKISDLDYFGIGYYTESLDSYGKYALTQLQQALDKKNIDYTHTKTHDTTLNTAHSDVLKISDTERITVFSFKNTDTAQKNASGISSDGFSVTSHQENGVQSATLYEWVAKPHWYIKDNIIILYIGDNGSIKEILTASYGEQFAGQ